MPMAALEALSCGALGMFTAECNLNDFFEFNAAILMPLDSDGIANTIERALNMDNFNKTLLNQNSYRLLNERYLWTSIVSELTKRIDEFNKSSQN